MSELTRYLESPQRFQSLFDNNLDLVLFQDAAGVILDANQPFLALVHRPKHEVVNRHINDFLPENLISMFRHKLEQAFQGVAVQFDVAVQFKGAEPKVLSISKVPLVVDGIIRGVHMIGRDITELTASHQLIAAQARKLNTIFESITDAFFLLDHEWRLTYLNKEMERMLRVEREQVLGRNLWDVFSQEVDGVFYEHYHQALQTNQAVHFEAFYATEQLWLEVKAFPSEDGLSVYFSNITSRKEGEARQQQLTQELYRHNQDLQQFTYLVSHNLRAPLANAIGLAQLLQGPTTDQDELLPHLQTSLQQLDTILQELNTVLTVRDRHHVTEPSEPVQLASVLDQVLLSLQESLQQSGANVTVQLPEELTVHGVRAYLYSIFLNLLTNAIRFRSAERPLQINITGEPAAQGGVHLRVSDNGSGFDREKAGTDVFKPYKRFHQAPAGRGLGLYLVHSHLEALGGRIEVSSQPGTGTTFQLFFLN